jgi:hypothetical protein
MKQVKYLAILSMLALTFPLGLFAREKNERNVDIPNSVEVSGTVLRPGSYKVAWQENGPQVQVTFLQYGKAVATVAATLKTNDGQVRQDEIQTRQAGGEWILTEIDFASQREALIFGQS